MKEQALPLVALVGRPNVGKSSLFNRLTKTRKAIVDPTPGVTRDRHYGKVVWQDKTFMLVDTGGIEVQSDEAMTSLIREQTWQAVREADIIVYLLDGREGVVGEDHEIAEFLRKSNKPIYCVINKIDNPEDEAKFTPAFFELGFPSLWAVSAAHGFGVGTLLDALTEQSGSFDVSEEAHADGAVTVAFIGRPNVGKSSLINRLLGEERMVVSDLPGTTRDSVDAMLEKEGDRFVLVDTAGIRKKGKVRHQIEKFSVLRALATLERCDLAILVIDAAEGMTDQDAHVVGYSLDRGRACLILVNKWDLIAGDPKRQKWILDDIERKTQFVGFAPTLNVSALSGKGINRILPAAKDVYAQYGNTFTTNQINRVLRNAVESHGPPMTKGRRLRFYYATQVATRPPTFVVFVNYPKEVHFSYSRYLTNRFRDGLKLDKSPLRIIFRERKRRDLRKS